MRIRQAPWALTALAALALALGGCGGTDEPEAAPEQTPASSPAAPTTSAAPEAPAPGTPVDPTATESDLQVGDGDAEGDDEPATEGGGICGDLEPAAVGRVLGGGTGGAALPGGGCAFTLTAAKGPSAGFIEKSFAKTPGGMAGAKTEATSAVEGTPKDVAGIGDAAFVVTGTAFGGDQIQGAGAVRVGDRLINVTLSQSVGLSATEVKARVLSLLTLAGAEAG